MDKVRTDIRGHVYADQLPLAMRKPLKGKYSAAVTTYCPHCWRNGLLGVEENRNKKGTFTRAGFSELDGRVVEMVECDDCFSTYFFHVTELGFSLALQLYMEGKK